MKSNIFFSMIVLLSFLFFLANVSEAVVPCSTVNMKAAACVTYATGKAPTPSQACCTGLQQLAGLVKTVDDKKDVCRCMKTAANSFKGGMQDKFLSQIPTACKIKVGFPVSTSINCDTIH